MNKLQYLFLQHLDCKGSRHSEKEMLLKMSKALFFLNSHMPGYNI